MGLGKANTAIHAHTNMPPHAESHTEESLNKQRLLPPDAGLPGLTLRRLPGGPLCIQGTWGGLLVRAPTVSAPRGTQKAVGLVLTGSLLSRLLYKAIDSNGENVGPIYNYRVEISIFFTRKV